MQKVRLVCISPDNRFNANLNRDKVASALLPADEFLTREELEDFRLNPLRHLEGNNVPSTPESA